MFGALDYLARHSFEMCRFFLAQISPKLIETSQRKLILDQNRSRRHTWNIPNTDVTRAAIHNPACGTRAPIWIFGCFFCYKAPRQWRFEMSFRSEIHTELGYTHLHISGTLVPPDGLKCTNFFRSNAALLSTYNQLVDFTKAEEFEVTFSDIATIVAQKELIFKEFKEITCIFLAPNDISFGVSRMYQQLAQGKFPFPVHVTRSPEHAIQSLGLQPEI